MEDLVSTEWLAGELGKPDLVVFDATKYLPNEPQHGREEFAAASLAREGTDELLHRTVRDDIR